MWLSLGIPNCLFYLGVLGIKVYDLWGLKFRPEFIVCFKYGYAFKL